VVFFKNQNINIEEQKALVQKIGELAGKPETSKLHVHPLFNSPDNSPINEQGEQDPHGEWCLPFRQASVELILVCYVRNGSVRHFVEESREVIQEYGPSRQCCARLGWLAF
jgi:hypothetical protein